MIRLKIRLSCMYNNYQEHWWEIRVISKKGRGIIFFVELCVNTSFGFSKVYMFLVKQDFCGWELSNKFGGICRIYSIQWIVFLIVIGSSSIIEPFSKEFRPYIMCRHVWRCRLTMFGIIHMFEANYYVQACAFWPSWQICHCHCALYWKAE